MTNNIIKNYFFGSEWLYYKFYIGESTSDKFLLEIIKPLVDSLIENKLIDKWFYIRYADPETHIRVRFHLTDVKFISDIAILIHNSTKYYTDNGFIHKIQLDTYKREIERYEYHNINECEELFFLNSRFNLSIIDEYGDSEERWLFGMKFIDELLRDFGYNLEEKRDLTKMLKTGFAEEFRADKAINQKLSNKYRAEKEKIIQCIETKSTFFEKNIKTHKKDFKAIISRIKSNNPDGEYIKVINNLIDSLIHMHCNRLFSTKQRAHEWVVYDLLFRYYEGKIARIKYSNEKEIGVSQKSFKE